MTRFVYLRVGYIHSPIARKTPNLEKRVGLQLTCIHPTFVTLISSELESPAKSGATQRNDLIQSLVSSNPLRPPHIPECDPYCSINPWLKALSLKLSNPSQLVCPTSFLHQPDISSLLKSEPTTSVSKQYIVGNNNVNTIYCSFTDTSLHFSEHQKTDAQTERSYQPNLLATSHYRWVC